MTKSSKRFLLNEWLILQCCDCEVVNMELFVSLDGVGLSLVNGKPDEVAYITLSRFVTKDQQFFNNNFKTLSRNHCSNQLVFITARVLPYLIPFAWCYHCT